MDKQQQIKSTDRAQNLNVSVAGERTVDDIEQVLDEIAGDLDLWRSHTTTLSKRKYPGNRHWHYKKNDERIGCLDITHWPDASLAWVTIRNGEPEWVHKAGAELALRLTSRLAS